MNRDQAFAHVAAEYAELVAVLGLEVDEPTFGAAVDAAWRALGVDTTATVDATRDGDTLALLDYYALRRMQRAAAMRIDVAVSVADASTRRSASQLSANIRALLDMALSEVRARGLDVGGGDGWSQGAIGLDFIEPRAGW